MYQGLPHPYLFGHEHYRLGMQALRKGGARSASRCNGVRARVPGVSASRLELLVGVRF